MPYYSPSLPYLMQAALCFRKAGAILEESIALAYHARKELRSLVRLAKSSKFASRYNEVGSAFQKCASKSTSTQAVSLYLVAADLYVEAGNHSSAAVCFEEAGQFDRAANEYFEAKKLDEAVRVVQQCEVTSKVKEKILYNAR